MELDEILGPVARGYSDWSGILSASPTYMLQCDFAYMIGPDMFERFVMPELSRTCSRLPRSFYHLDGVGQLAHLDQLLSIDDLNGIQWVPGSGKGAWEEWNDVIKAICDGGKLAQVYGGFDTLDAVVDAVGDNGSKIEICLNCPGGPEREAEVRERLARYGVE